MFAHHVHCPTQSEPNARPLGAAQLPDVGILAGSRVETEAGWRPVAALSAGTAVATFDGGFCPLVSVERHLLRPASDVSLIHFPAGALNNCSAFSAMPGQHVLVVSDAVEEVLGCSGALIPASALAGHWRISRRSLLQPVDIVTLCFADEEVLYVNSGALIHCMGETSAAGGVPEGSGYFDVLDAARGKEVLALVDA